jgi:hypothetical protein
MKREADVASRVDVWSGHGNTRRFRATAHEQALVLIGLRTGTRRRKMAIPQELRPLRRYDVAKLVAKLDRRSPIRFWMESDRKTEEGSAEELFHSLAQTEETAWADRAVAFHMLGVIDLAPLEREHAMRLLLNALQWPEKEKISIVRFGGALGIALINWSVLCIGMGIVSPPRFDLSGLPGLLLASLLTTPAILRVQNRNRAYLTQRIAASALASVGNAECLAALYTQARQSSHLRQEANQALKSLLPSVTGEWYGQLSSAASMTLTKLARSYNVEMALAALDALERAGNGSCVKEVERIAALAPGSRVSDRAAEVCRILIARQAQETAAATLLRPSAGQLTDGLLRPVYNGDPNVTNLLRASHVETQEEPL